MARYRGVLGFGESVLTAPGVYDDVVVTRTYKGNVIRNYRSFNQESEVNGEIAISHSISIVADEYAMSHLQQIRFIEWAGDFWTVSSIQIQRPRLILGVGGVYNGPTS